VVAEGIAAVAEPWPIAVILQADRECAAVVDRECVAAAVRSVVTERLLMAQPAPRLRMAAVAAEPM
jgi:hypothetical protein